MRVLKMMARDPQLKLQPRLFMLAHSGRHLSGLLESARQQQRSFAEYLSPVPINWDVLLRQASPLRQTQLESESALHLPAMAGIQAYLQAPALQQEIKLQTTYQLPELVFELLDPRGQSVQQLEIRCGCFTTFAQGRADRQLLEYLATLIGYELAALGFSCQRGEQGLVFAAEPVMAGWNLNLRHLSYPDSSLTHPLERCSAGLHEGLSSRQQQAGRLAFVHWGPYLLNNQRCEVVLPFSPDLSSFAEAFVEELNQQLALVQLAAVWTPAQTLLITHTQPGQAIQVQALPQTPIQAPDLRLELALPEGRFGRSEQLQPAAELKLNGVSIALNAAPEPGQSMDVCIRWLTQQFNHYQQITGVHAAVTPEQHLHLQALRPQQTLVIDAVSGSFEAACGLSAMQIGGLDEAGLDAALKRWTLLLNQVLRDLPEQDVFRRLAEAARQVPALAGHYDDGVLWNESAVTRFIEPIMHYLELITLEVDQCLNNTSQTAVSLRPLQLELEMTPHQPQTPSRPDQNESESSEQPIARFDHKI